MTAQVILAETGDIKRFPSYKKFVGFTGLGISERSSGGRIRRGGICKQGNTHVRWLLVEAAHKAKRSDPNLKCYFDRIACRRGRNKATVAVARKLAKICCWLICTIEAHASCLLYRISNLLKPDSRHRQQHHQRLGDLLNRTVSLFHLSRRVPGWRL